MGITDLDCGGVCVTIAFVRPKFTFRLENSRYNVNGKIYIQSTNTSNAVGEHKSVDQKSSFKKLSKKICIFIFAQLKENNAN